MSFFEDIFQRKAKPSPLPVLVAERQRDELADLHTALDMRRAQIAGFLAGVRQCDAELLEVTRLSTALKVRIAENDPTATVSLDSLDKEELATRRRRDGLLSKIATAESELQPLVNRANALTVVREQERQDRLVRTVRDRALQELDELEALWREACNEAFDLMTTMSAPIGGPIPVALDDEHKALVLGIRNDINSRLQMLRLERVNGSNGAGWEMTTPGLLPDLQIVPGRPRAPLVTVCDEIAKVAG